MNIENLIKETNLRKE